MAKVKARITTHYSPLTKFQIPNSAKEPLVQRALLFIAPLILTAIPAAAQTAADPAARAAAVAPFLDDQTLAVGRINLAKLDPTAIVKLLGEVAGDKSPEAAQQFAALEQQAKARLHVLTHSGFSELYAVFSLADMPKEPLLVIAPVKAGGDAQKTAEALRELLHFEAADVRAGAVVVSSQRIIDRLKTLQPTPRPEIAKGFEQAGDTAIQLIISPSDDTRRVLREMLPRLPDQIGGSGKVLADGIEWAVLSVDLPPRPSLSLTIQSNDADSAAALRALAISGLALLREDRGVQKIPQLDDVIRTLTPRLMGDRLIVNADDRDGSARTLLNVLAPAIQAARTAAGRNQSINNLKQIALATHMYHDTHNRLPPQAIRSKDGKPLLSWRVALLPYLDASPLYKEFHLDEPWDSEHNKKLIEKMPAPFASPHLGDMRKAQGLTSYVAPLSRQPPATFVPPAPGAAPPTPAKRMPLAIFDDPAGAALRQITDGTSNTILILEAHPNSAVPWTKPDDVVIDAEDLAAKLRGQPDNAFAAAFADGSVRMIKLTVDPKVLLRLLQMNDGQAVGEY